MSNTEPVVANAIRCIGFIMDGNRRWAKEQGLSPEEGHKKGYEKLNDVVRWAREARIPHIVVYAFSTENWQRSEKEVGYLMQIFKFILENEVEKMMQDGVRVRFVGELSRFSPDMQEMMVRVEARGAEMECDITLHLALSYGGRTEIISVVNRLLEEGKKSVSEEEFSRLLWTGDMPNPDLIVRTGGEKRLSNFLPWQSVYSELFFSDTKWPDFTKEEFESILSEFAARERRHGK